MRKTAIREPDYGNWVTARLIIGLGALTFVFLILALVLPVFIIVALFLFCWFIYFVYSRYQFSPKGGNLQARIRSLVLDHLAWDGNGEALDIGCGNGPLAIEVAGRYPNARVTGIDYWGEMWEYSQKQCEENAALAGVSGRVNFRKASASRLPFPEGKFDAVVSHFVFHEVQDAKDKREVVKEALRVVKKGGVFAFQDLFLVKRFYGGMEDLLEALKGMGVERIEFVRTSDCDFIPGALKLPFMVGEIGILYGIK